MRFTHVEKSIPHDRRQEHRKGVLRLTKLATPLSSKLPPSDWRGPHPCQCRNHMGCHLAVSQCGNAERRRPLFRLQKLPKTRFLWLRARGCSVLTYASSKQSMSTANRYVSVHPRFLQVARRCHVSISHPPPDVPRASHGSSKSSAGISWAAWMKTS